MLVIISTGSNYITEREREEGGERETLISAGHVKLPLRAIEIEIEMEIEIASIFVLLHVSLSLYSPLCRTQ